MFNENNSKEFEGFEYTFSDNLYFYLYSIIKNTAVESPVFNT